MSKKTKLHLREDLDGKWYWVINSGNGKTVDGSTESFSRRAKAIENYNTATRLRCELHGLIIPAEVRRAEYNFFIFLSEDEVVETRQSAENKRLHAEKKKKIPF